MKTQFLAYSYDDPDEASVIYMDEDFYDVLDFCRGEILHANMDPERHCGPVIYAYQETSGGQDHGVLERQIRIGRVVEMMEGF